MDPGSEELRRRAVELRRVAAAISAVGIDELIGWAGPDTWRSPGCRCLPGDAGARPPAPAARRRRAARRRLAPRAAGRRRRRAGRAAPRHMRPAGSRPARSRRPNNQARRCGRRRGECGARQPGHPHRAPGVPAHLHDPELEADELVGPVVRLDADVRGRRGAPRPPVGAAPGGRRMASSWPDGSRLRPSQSVTPAHVCSSRQIVRRTSSTCSAAGRARPASISAVRPAAPPG